MECCAKLERAGAHSIEGARKLVIVLFADAANCTSIDERRSYSTFFIGLPQEQLPGF